MTIRPISKFTKVLGLVSLVAISGVASIGVFAADNTNVSLEVTGGQLTIYAGDATNNNDICTPANNTAGTVVDTTTSGGSATSVTCAPSESAISLSGLTVASSRQNATATIYDVLFEDLRGLAAPDYTVTATVSDFSAGAGKTIALGSNPDAVTSDTDSDAPTVLADTNKLFAAVNPSVGTITILRDATTIANGTTNYSKGSNTTVVSTSSAVTLESTTGGVRPGRVDLDGTTFKLRVPALVQAGSYTGTITQTII
jgi:hypothetical protein